MKVYVGENKLLLIGKCWEIKHTLKQYNARYTYIHQWVNDCEKTSNSKN